MDRELRRFGCHDLYSNGFEVAESFNGGPLNGQNGWVAGGTRVPEAATLALLALGLAGLGFSRRKRVS